MVADRVERERKTKNKHAIKMNQLEGTISSRMRSMKTGVRARLGQKIEPAGLTISVRNDDESSYKLTESDYKHHKKSKKSEKYYEDEFDYSARRSRRDRYDDERVY